MGRKFLLLPICVLVLTLLPGCGETAENHSALSMKEEGYWDERYSTWKTSDQGEWHVEVSINTKKDMEEKDMLKILDYYMLNLTESGLADKAAVYGVFYKEDTDEEISRFKYVDGESTDIPAEEQYYFPAPALHNQNDE